MSDESPLVILLVGKGRAMSEGKHNSKKLGRLDIHLRPPALD